MNKVIVCKTFVYLSFLVITWTSPVHWHKILMLLMVIAFWYIEDGTEVKE